MDKKAVTLLATPEGLLLTFDPPISIESRNRVLRLLHTEYQLDDALSGMVMTEVASRRFSPGEVSGVVQLRLASWRPHGMFPESLLEKLERDILLILAREPVERTRIAPLEFPKD